MDKNYQTALARIRDAAENFSRAAIRVRRGLIRSSVQSSRFKPTFAN
jgi:hypothetical protein